MRYLSIIITTVLILIAISIPGSKMPHTTGFTGLDKVVHVFMFYVWSLSVQFDTSVKFRWNRILVIGIGFGLLTELLQLAAKNRSFDWYDWLFDSLGLLLAALSGNLILPYLEPFWFFRWLKNQKGN
jgi:VanZ family protein